MEKGAAVESGEEGELDWLRADVDSCLLHPRG